jgi:fatty acid desaturase
MGSLLNEYRVKHWQHHKNLGKTSDPENSYFKGLNLKNILGYLFLLHIFEKIFFVLTRTKPYTKILSKNYFVILLFISIHSLNLISIFLYTNLIGSIIYLLSFFVCFPFFAVIRQTLEHRSDDADDHVNYTFENHGESNRLFNNNFFSRFFGAAGFNKHLLHHLNPNISYTIFDNFEKKLNQESRFQILLQQSRSSYGETLYKMILRK